MSGDQSYEGLLQQITVVNQQLQEARTVISTFKKENAELVGNFDTCRGALEELRVKYNGTKEELLAATERQMLTDQKHEAQMKSVWARIATAENVAEELRQQYVPEDLDVLRIQIQGELEEPHKARLAELENEVLKWETAYYATRRTLEKEKTEHDLWKEQVKAAIDNDHGVFDADVASLKAQLEVLQNHASMLSLDESLIEAQSEIASQQHINSKLKQENDDLRRELLQSEADRKDAEVAHHQQCEALRAELTGIKADLVAQEQLTTDATAEASAKRAEAEALRHRAAEKALAASKREEGLATRESAAQELQARLEADAKRLRGKLEADAKKRQDKLDFEIEQHRDARAAADEEAANCRDRVERAMASEEEARADARQHLEEFEAQLDAERREHAKDREELKRVEYGLAEAQRSKTDELKAKEAEVAKAVREAQLLKGKVTKQAEEAKAERRDKEHVDKKLKEKEDRLRQLQESLSKTDIKVTELAQAEQAKGAALKHLQEEYSSLVTQLDTQRKEHAAAVMKLQSEHEAERAQALTSTRHQLDGMKLHAAAALSREKKKTTKYKDAAHQAHGNQKKIKQQLVLLAKENTC